MSRPQHPMQSGELRHVIDIEQLVVGHDSTGAPTSTYVTWAAGVRCAIDDQKSIESFISNQATASLTTRIRTRWRPGIRSAMRIAHLTNPGEATPVLDHYEIKGVIRDVTLRNELQLMCERLAAH